MESQAFYQASGEIDARIAAALAKLALVGRHALGRQAAARSLSAMQSLVLDRLARFGPTRVSQLASQLSVTVPTVSDSVAALEKKGLVFRRSVAQDARSVEVCLTPRGRRLARSQDDWTETFRTAVAELGQDEKVVVLRLLLRIIARLVENGVVRDARMCVTCEYFRAYAHPGSGKPHHCALVDLPLSDEHLRVDCHDHVAVAPDALRRRLRVLENGTP